MSNPFLDYKKYEHKKGNTTTYDVDHPFYGEKGIEKRVVDSHNEYLRKLKEHQLPNWKEK